MTTYHTHIHSYTPLTSPTELKACLPITKRAEETVLRGRKTIENILDDKDARKIFLIGPCSIHNIKEAEEYAIRLKLLAEKVQDKIFVVMRSYFEKPRTSVGWKGLLNDPDLNGTCNIERGLYLAREFLLFLAENEIPSATEALDPFTPPFLSDLISYYSIGARTVESQPHREMASGLSAPVGFKNTTNGCLEAATNGIICAKSPHYFIGINQEARAAIFQTAGNAYGHLILRGGKTNPNFDSLSVSRAHKLLLSKGIRDKILIDCSHDNSGQDYRNQPDVLRHIVDQMRNSHTYVVGAMLESNHKEGNQKFVAGKIPEYGTSITDGCLSFETTERIVLEAHDLLP